MMTQPHPPSGGIGGRVVGSGCDCNVWQLVHVSSRIKNELFKVTRHLCCKNRHDNPAATVDLETLEPHIIASYTIIRQMRPTLLHTSVRNDQCDLSH